jgi:hypothetical protein
MKANNLFFSTTVFPEELPGVPTIVNLQLSAENSINLKQVTKNFKVWL